VTAERLKKWATVGWSRTLEGLACAGGEDPYGDATFRAACRLGSLVHLVGTTDQAVEELVDVAVGLGLSEREARSNAERGVRKGGEDGPPKDLPTELLSFIGSPDGARSTQTRPQPARATKPEKPKRMTPEDLEAVEAASVPLGESEAGLIWARKRLGDAAERLVGRCDEVRVLKKGERLPSCFRGPVGRAGVVLFPTYDAEGLAGWRARPIEPSGPKALAPSGCAVEGHVLADAGGRALLRGDLDKPDPLVVVVVEGETDYLAWCSQDHKRFGIDAVLGVVNRAWTPELGQRIPAGATVHLRTDLDEAGDDYAAAVAATLPSSVTVLRKRPIRGPAAAGAEEAGAVLDDEADLLLAGSEVLEASWKASTPYGEEAGEQPARSNCPDYTTDSPCSEAAVSTVSTPVHPVSTGGGTAENPRSTYLDGTFSTSSVGGVHVVPGFVWDEPQTVRLERPRVEGSWLAGPVSDYVKDVAVMLEQGLAAAMTAVLVVLASVVARFLVMRPRRGDDWLVSPNLLALLLGRPGSGKSPVARAALELLKPLEEQAAEACRKAKTGYEVDLQAWREQNDPTLPQPVKPELPTVLEVDLTPERLVEKFAESPAGFLFFRDEALGFLKSFTKKGFEELRSVFLTAFDGLSGYKVDRISGRSVNASRMCLSFLGTSQLGPFLAWLEKCATGDADDGLFSRFQLVSILDRPTKQEWREAQRLRKEWMDTYDLEDRRRRKQIAIDYVTELGNIDPEQLGAVMEDRPFGRVGVLEFSDEAQALFDTWWDGHQLRKLSMADDDPMLEVLSKWEGFVPSLALILRCARTLEPGPVEVADLRHALFLADYYEGQIRRLLGMRKNPVLPSEVALGKTILEKGLVEFSTRDIYRVNRKNPALCSAEKVRDAARSLETSGWVTLDAGREGEVWLVNPQLKPEHLVGVRLDRGAA
jgi:hypothetical protein